MSRPARLDERVTQLETEMAEVRFLATKAESEVSDMQTVFRGHTGVLNAIRDDQTKQGKTLARVEKEIHAGFARVDEEFADVRTEMRTGFGELARGQELITNLLTRHLGEPDEETQAGDADE